MPLKAVKAITLQHIMYDSRPLPPPCCCGRWIQTCRAARVSLNPFFSEGEKVKISPPSPLSNLAGPSVLNPLEYDVAVIVCRLPPSLSLSSARASCV